MSSIQDTLKQLPDTYSYIKSNNKLFIQLPTTTTVEIVPYNSKFKLRIFQEDGVLIESYSSFEEAFTEAGEHITQIQT